MSDEQYFTTQPQVASVAHTKQQNFAVLRVADRELLIGTDRGVFSRKGIDQGTMVLLESAARPPSTGNFLDLGCGAGPIALTLAAYSPNATVYAIDINDRARELTDSNAQRNRLSNVVTCAPNEIDDAIQFDVLWSNPPIRIGKQELHALLLTWLSRLSATGGMARHQSKFRLRLTCSVANRTGVYNRAADKQTRLSRTACDT